MTRFASLASLLLIAASLAAPSACRAQYDEASLVTPGPRTLFLFPESWKVPHQSQGGSEAGDFLWNLGQQIRRHGGQLEARTIELEPGQTMVNYFWDDADAQDLGAGDKIYVFHAELTGEGLPAPVFVYLSNQGHGIRGFWIPLRQVDAIGRMAPVAEPQAVLDAATAAFDAWNTSDAGQPDPGQLYADAGAGLSLLQ